jgi:uncharacterized protein YecT (DUF1311 family)
MDSAFLLGFVLASAAPANPGADPQLEHCLATAQGIAPVRLCYKTALARVDAAVAERMASLPARLRAGHVPPAALAKGDAAWKAYRNSWCAFEEAAEHDAGARDTTGLQCRVELGQDHLARLKHAY